MRTRLLRLAMLLSCMASMHSVQAGDRWEEAAGGAVAILPAPTQASGITGGSLYCAEQKWGFLFRTEGADPLPGPVKIGLEGRTLALEPVRGPGTLQVSVPTDILEPLKTGTRMRVSIGADKPVAQATFNLRNSGKVMEAIAPRCSQIDMSAYQTVSLAEEGPPAAVATVLLADEIRLFREAVKKEPTIAAAQIDRPDGKRLLFASLCGSTFYYGSSGCTLAGWAAEGAGDWQSAYATEGVRLYLDESRTHDGWPGLATLAMVNGIEAIHWTWTGSGYEAQGGALLAEDETVGKSRAAQ